MTIQEYEKIAQVGDRIVTNGDILGQRIGEEFIGVVYEINERGFYMEIDYKVKSLSGWYISFKNDQAYVDVLESNNKKEKTMNLLEKFTQTLLSEPEKTFRKVGVTNGDNILTEEGQKIFLTWLLGKYGDDFKKEVVDKLVEEEKKK